MHTYLSQKPGGQYHNYNDKTQGDLNPRVHRNRQDHLAYTLSKLFWLKVVDMTEHVRQNVRHFLNINAGFDAVLRCGELIQFA